MSIPMEARSESTDTVDMFDVEKYRKSHESRREWSLRRTFLLAHQNRFPEDRLVCLSHCFVNIEVYGCRYPSAVMDTLVELAVDIQSELDSHRQYVKGKEEVKFVKGSDSASSGPGSGKEAEPVSSLLPQTSNITHQVQLASSSLPSTCRNIANQQKPTSSLMAPSRISGGLGMMFVKSTTDYKSTDYKQSVIVEKSPALMKHFDTKPINKETSADSLEDSLTVKFNTVARHLQVLTKPDLNPISLLHLAVDKARMNAHCDFRQVQQKSKAELMFCCELKIDFVTIATGEARNKKEAKQLSYSTAIQKICSPFIRVVRRNPERLELENSSKPFTELKGVQILNIGSAIKESNAASVSGSYTRKRPNPSSVSNLTDFLIMESVNPATNPNALTILRQSADFNKRLLEYEFCETGSNADDAGIRCEVLIDKILLADCWGRTKTNAKLVASEKALELLCAQNWIIKVKKFEDSDAAGLSKEELLGAIGEKQAERIPESNIGNKLLKKMGWMGGGVGREGREGISVPVSVSSIINRQGLGLQAEQGIAKNFVQSVKDLINSYAKSNKQDDLAFSPEFTKEERAIIHKEAQKIGLKSGSKGFGDDRYLIIGRKRTAGQLFEHILQRGGTTSKYELVPPGGELQSGDNSQS